jgi:hypothetical protein
MYGLLGLGLMGWAMTGLADPMITRNKKGRSVEVWNFLNEIIKHKYTDLQLDGHQPSNEYRK